MAAIYSNTKTQTNSGIVMSDVNHEDTHTNKSNKESQMTYTLNNKAETKSKLNIHIETAVHAMYGQSINIAEDIKSSLTQTIKQSLKLSQENKYVKDVEYFMPEADFKSAVAAYTPEKRSKLWEYRKLAKRIILLEAILANKRRTQYLVLGTLEKLLEGILSDGNNYITLGQLIHNIPLNETEIKIKSKGTVKTNAWMVDEIRLQLVSEMAELNLIDIKLEAKTHTVSIPEQLTNIIPQESWTTMRKMSLVVKRKTILTEPAVIEHKDMISQSSWWYKTPTLSVDQKEFVGIMNNLQWEFTHDAEEVIAEQFKQHLKVAELPEWAEARVEEYKAQIRASHQNQGHYISGKFDSALRWYWQSEIGHNQTSSALRSIVKPVGITNPVKYDMSNNVVQMYALGLKDKSLAKYVGLVADAEGVEDLREQIAYQLNHHLGIQSFNKDNVKPLFMIWAYNAGKTRLLNGVYKEEIHFFTKQKVITQVTPGLRELANQDKKIDDNIIWNKWNGILNALVPSIVELKNVMNKIMRGNPLMEASWILPDNAVAQYASVETKGEALQWITKGLHQHTHTHHRKELTKGVKAAGLLPRMVHSIDAYIMRQIVLRAYRVGITIVPNHDSFMFDKCYTKEVFDIVKQIFVEVMDNNVFYQIVQSYNKANITESGDYVDREELTAEDILAGTPMKLEA